MEKKFEAQANRRKVFIIDATALIANVCRVRGVIPPWLEAAVRRSKFSASGGCLFIATSLSIS